MTSSKDFLGNTFQEFVCKRCTKTFRRMAHDKLMPVCPRCEPEDTAAWQNKRNKPRGK